MIRPTASCLIACGLVLTTLADETNSIPAQGPPRKGIQFRVAEDATSPGDSNVSVKEEGKDRPLKFSGSVLLNDSHIEFLLCYSGILHFNNEPPRPESYIRFKFTEEGTKILEKVTSENFGKKLAILVNGQVIVAPKVGGKVDNREMALHFPTWQEALEAYKKLRAPVEKQ